MYLNNMNKIFDTTFTASASPLLSLLFIIVMFSFSHIDTISLRTVFVGSPPYTEQMILERRHLHQLLRTGMFRTRRNQS